MEINCVWASLQKGKLLFTINHAVLGSPYFPQKLQIECTKYTEEEKVF